MPGSVPLIPNSTWHSRKPCGPGPEQLSESALLVAAAFLELPKLLIHTKENMKAALLTSLMDSPSMWRKKELCGSSSHSTDFLTFWGSGRGSLRAANSPIKLLELESFSEFLMLGGPFCALLRGSEAHPQSSPIIKMWKPFTLSVFQIHGNNHNATLNAYSS